MVNLHCKVWVPGHISCFFEAFINNSLNKTGSTGAGINLDKGLFVEVNIEESSDTLINCSGTGELAIKKLLEREDRTYKIDVSYEYELPTGMGFGMSGAEALGSVIAVSKAINLPTTINRLARTAHHAEVELMSGLGDVGAQLQQGVTINTKPGTPGKGGADRIITRDREIYIATLDRINTSSILKDEKTLEKINYSGRNKLKKLLKKPTLNKMTELGRDFSKETGIAPQKIEKILDELKSEGVNASMAMIGQTIFAFEKPELISEHGELIETKIALTGPKIID
ncbi:hypothetical protein [Methanonatronarchaeum sp. AMET-Sl]|uniref:pantoate kinase n=1 Tax=Methanonatronarchaeum sp. AMET-Sl TaxID=3037654 RepID=UPI00244DD72B|nr:hypothetical protein [Methanonatronarchaeum sp. AMET-Sl]WGI17237.1 hypothetical protein QEN48_06970 [Methanonatronarchaeum sp. AMET-Sl]